MSNQNRDTQHLAQSQYSTAENVEARWGLYDYCMPKIDMHQAGLDALQLQGSEDLLELGCAAGKLLLGLRLERHHSGRLVGLEINETITRPTEDYLALHPEIQPIEFIAGSADSLPFEDNSFDVLLGFFMLYHMPDIQKTLIEWRRVLRPGGKLLVTTASRDNRPKGKALKYAMAEAAGVTAHAKFSEAFDLENAKEQLEQVFIVDDEFIYRGELQVPDREVLLRSVNSDRDMYTPIPDDEAWAKAVALAEKTFDEERDQYGYFSDQVIRGYFLCS